MAKARRRQRPSLAAGVLVARPLPPTPTDYDLHSKKDCPSSPLRSPLRSPKAATISDCNVNGGGLKSPPQPSTLPSSTTITSDNFPYALERSVRPVEDSNKVSSNSTTLGLEFSGCVPRSVCGFSGGVRPPPACSIASEVCPPPACKNAPAVCPPPVCEIVNADCTPPVCDIVIADCTPPVCVNASVCGISGGVRPPPACGNANAVCRPPVCHNAYEVCPPCARPTVHEVCLQAVCVNDAVTVHAAPCPSPPCEASLPASVPLSYALAAGPTTCSVLAGDNTQAPAFLEGGSISFAAQTMPASLASSTDIVLPPTKSSTQPLSYAHVASQAVAPVLDRKGSCINHVPVHGNCAIKQPSLHQGKPAILFKVSEKQQLIGNMKHVLVGKFSHGRPPINVIREFFVKLNLKGEYNLSLFDTRHLFIECSLLEDFTRLWVRLTWHIQRFAMRLFKWTPDFTPERESPLCPVWIHLPRLPLYMFQESCLLSVANTIGRPLSLDSNNVKRIKLGEASVCVELDASQPLVHETWIGFEEDTGEDGQPPKVIDGFWQHVVYDDCPAYCLECYHLGHASSACKRGNGKEKAVVQEKIQVENLGTTSSSKNAEATKKKVRHEAKRSQQLNQNGSTKSRLWQQKNSGVMNVAISEGAKVQATQNTYSVPTQNRFVDLDKVEDLSDVCLPHSVSSAPPSPKVPPSDNLSEVGVSEKKPSWADLAEEDITIISKLTLLGEKEYAIKQIEKIMNSDDEGCKTAVTVQDKSETLAEHAEGNGDDYKTPTKPSSRSFSTDLPDLGFDPPIASSSGGEATTMSTLLANNHLLVARRSVSPKGRSSQKLKSLRHKVDTLDFADYKADVVDREDYSELGHELRRGVASDLSF